MDTFGDIIAIALAAAPWLLVGLLAAGVLHALMPRDTLKRWAGGNGLAAISRAAVLGVPLPLCSCGAIPTALSLYRAGAGRGPTTAFLVSTPGVGVDSMAITYALLGPFMVLARVLGAFVTAVTTALLVAVAGGEDSGDRAGAAGTGGKCTDACAPNGCSAGGVSASGSGTGLANGIRHAFTDLLDDISAWLLVGLAVAGVIVAFVPPQALAAMGSGIVPMVIMAVIGIPMYLCATAATPVAAALLIAGVSPGTVLVLLLAGPVTSMATLGVLRRDMGLRALIAYLGGILGTTVLCGLALDQVIAHSAIDLAGTVQSPAEWLPPWVEAIALATLLVVAIRPLRRWLARLGPATVLRES